MRRYHNLPGISIFFQAQRFRKTPGEPGKTRTKTRTKPAGRPNVFALSSLAESEGLLSGVNPGVALVAQAVPPALRDIFTAL
jgi:hypothetical protein